MRRMDNTAAIAGRSSSGYDDDACEWSVDRFFEPISRIIIGLLSSHMDTSLKIVIVDESPIRAAILEDGLREAGFSQVVRIEETTNLLARVYALDPDVILIDLENPSRDVLEQM